MGLFGLSRKEKFVRKEASNLANYLKNNAVKAGGEAYAKCQLIDVLPASIDKSLLWYFWSIIFAFRVAHETLALKGIINDETGRELFHAFIDIDNDYFQSIAHTPYQETFASVNVAIELIKANGTLPLFESAAMYMLSAVKVIPDLNTQEQTFNVVKLLAEAASSFPSLNTIIDQHA